MMWIWHHDKRTDDYKIILNCIRRLMKKLKMRKSGWERPKLKQKCLALKFQETLDSFENIKNIGFVAKRPSLKLKFL